jgi:hypothetical protein
MDKEEITLEDIELELENRDDTNYNMSGGAKEPEPEISSGSIELASDSESESETETDKESTEEEPDGEPEPENSKEESQDEQEPPSEEVEVAEPTDEMPQGEFILDDEDFQMVETSEEIVIKEETVLPVYKVVLGDEEQETDIFNELVKQLPERLRENKNELMKIQRQIGHYSTLKQTHGIMDGFDNIVAPKFLMNNYKPLKTSFIEHGDYSNPLFSPILDQKKLLYNVETLDKDNNMPNFIESDEIGADNVLVRNVDKIKEQWGIAEKFRKTNARLNYSYNSQVYETILSIDDSVYTPQSAPGFFTNFKKDTAVYSSIFENSDLMYYTRGGYKSGNYNHSIMMGNLGTNFEPEIKGSKANIIGFMRKPGGLFNGSNYPNKPLKDTIVDFSPENLAGVFPIKDSQVEHIDLNIDEGSNVKVCFAQEQYETTGTVKSINDEKYVVKTSEGEEELELLKSDTNVSVKQVVDNRNCFRKDLTVFKFPEKSLTEREYSDILDDILPSQNSVVYGLKSDIEARDEEMVNFSDFNELLSNYNLTYDHLTSDLRKVLTEIIETNNKKLINKTRSVKMEYKRFLQSVSGNKNTKRSEKIELLNRKLLTEFRDYYGEYPHYDTSIDSVKERFKWLISRKDQGTLLFKSVILKVYNLIYKQADTTSEKLREYVNKTNMELMDKKTEIEKRKSEIIEQKSKGLCPDKRLVKIYHRNSDLEADNGKVVYPDENLRSNLLDKDIDKVNVGSYCVLAENNEKRLFVRSLVGDREMWVLDESKNIDNLITSNLDYCNFQASLLKDLDSSIYKDSNRCKFQEDIQTCIDIKLFTAIKNYNEKNEKFLEKKRILLLIENSGTMLQRLEDMVVTLKKNLKLNEKLNEKLYLKRETVAEEIKKGQAEAEYSDLYNKIDKYLVKINKLPDEQMYPLLMELLAKYGRDADLSSDENPKNVYCNMGSKVITCKHHVFMAKYFQNPEESSSVLNYVKDTFCIDGGDQFYCMNCGQSVYIADYEEIEGFSSTGAYQTTTEVMTPDEEEELEAKVTETVASITAFLEADNDNNANLDDLVKLFELFLKTTGLKLTEKDEQLILSLTLELNKANIRSKNEWLSRQKKVPKNQNVIDMAYKNYENRNTILHFSSAYFTVVQSAEKQYKITKSHSKCTVSLRGKPLEKQGTQGIDYFTCILEGLRDTNSGIFKSLKKVKIADELTKSVTAISEDPLIKMRQMRANIEREEQAGEKVENVVNNWVQFKPTLNKINVALENTDVSEADMKNKETINELKLLLSLKGMENINNKINESDIENSLFDPIPIDNTCCKVQITDDFNYNKYFDKELSKINDTLNKIEAKTQDNKMTKSKIKFTIENPREKIPRFDKEIVPENKGELDLNEFNVNFVTRGSHIGERHLFDENGICQLSGESREMLQKTKFGVQEFTEYSDNLNKKKLFKVLINTLPMENIDTLQSLRRDNKMVKENKYISQFIDTLMEVITGDETPENKFTRLERLYTSLEEQIITELDELTAFITKRDSRFSNYSDFLRNLGNFTQLSAEMEEKIGKEVTKERMSNNKEKYMKRLFKQIKVTVNKIAHGNITDPELIKKGIPGRWKLTESYKDKLVFNVDKSSRIIADYKQKSDSILNGMDVFMTMSETVSQLTENLDSITGKPHILDCDGNIMFYSELTSEITSNILHYLFVLLLNNLTTNALTLDDKVGSTIRNRINFTGADAETAEETKDDDREAEEDLEATEDISGFSIEIDESIREREELTINFIVDFIKNLNADYSLIDKHTDQFINKTLAKISDEEKEQNLKFIEDLDRETRASFKVMLMTGIDTWKNLAAKDKSLYFREQIPEDEMVPVDNSETDIASACTELGVSAADLTDEQLNEWRELRDRTLGETQQAMNDMDVLPDDDGDYTDEHEGY